MSKFRTLAAAGVATISLTAGAALTGSIALADDGHDAATNAMPKQLAAAARKAPSGNCSGGAQTDMSSRTGSTVTAAGNTTVNVPSSSWTIKGPKKGKDTVLVTVSGLAYSPSLMYAGLYRDGALAGPTKYFSYTASTNYDQASAQFCAKVGKGLHTFDVRLQISSGSTDYLYYPTVTYQRFE